MQIREIEVKNVMTKSNLPVSDFSVNPYSAIADTEVIQSNWQMPL